MKKPHKIDLRVTISQFETLQRIAYKKNLTQSQVLRELITKEVKASALKP